MASHIQKRLLAAKLTLPLSSASWMVHKCPHFQTEEVRTNDRYLAGRYKPERIESQYQALLGYCTVNLLTNKKYPTVNEMIELVWDFKEHKEKP